MTLSKEYQIQRELERKRRKPSQSLTSILHPEEVGPRFWELVHKHTDGCWYWIGHYWHDDEFGRSPFFQLGRGRHPPSQVAWILVHGRIGKNRFARPTRCRNRFCVNPAHHTVWHGRPREWRGKISRWHVQRLYRDHKRKELTIDVLARDLPVNGDTLRRYFKDLERDERIYKRIVSWRNGDHLERYDHPKKQRPSARRPAGG